MKQIILPTNIPITTVYPVDANATMIVSNNEEYLPWLFNSFIQLTSRCSYSPITYFDFHYRSIPTLYVQKVNKDMMNTSNKASLFSLLRDALNNKYYPYLMINKKYIPAYKTNFDIAHDMLIYGYSEEEGLFYIADAFVNGKYSFSTCTYEELFKAVNNLSEKDNNYMGFKNSIEFLRLHEDETAKLNLTRITTSLKDYLECTPSTYWYTQQFNFHNPMSNHLFGLDTYKLIYKRLEMGLAEKEIRHESLLSLCVVREHKSIMKKRLEYLKEHKMIDNPDEFIEAYKNIEHKASVCLNLVLKYKISKCNRSIERAFEKYKELEEDEAKVIGKMINNISN